MMRDAAARKRPIEATREADALAYGREVIRAEAQALEGIAARLDDSIRKHLDSRAIRKRGRPRVFVSHRHKDEKIVRALVECMQTYFHVDKQDIRNVLHYHVPGSLEAYAQEAGRGGRDGKPTRCVLLFNHADIKLQEFLIDASYPSAELLRGIWKLLRDQPPLGRRDAREDKRDRREDGRDRAENHRDRRENRRDHAPGAGARVNAAFARRRGPAEREEDGPDVCEHGHKRPPHGTTHGPPENHADPGRAERRDRGQQRHAHPAPSAAGACTMRRLRPRLDRRRRHGVFRLQHAAHRSSVARSIQRRSSVRARCNATRTAPASRPVSRAISAASSGVVW